jgi:hypothetical protein
MANYPKYTLTGKTPAATYPHVVQYNVESSSFVDGFGNDLPPISCSWASASLSSSYLSASNAIITNATITTGTYGLLTLPDNQISYSLDFSSFYTSVNTSQPTFSFVSSSNGTAVRNASVFIVSQSISRSISFNPNWIVLGKVPTVILPNKTAILSVTTFGPNESDVVVAYGVQGITSSPTSSPAAIPMLLVNTPAFGYKICNWDSVLSQMTTSSCSPSVKPEWDGVFNQLFITSTPYPVWYFTGSSIGGNEVGADATPDWPDGPWISDGLTQLFCLNGIWHLQIGCAGGIVWWIGTGNSTDINNPSGSYFIDNGTFGAINLGTIPEIITVNGVSDI